MRSNVDQKKIEQLMKALGREAIVVRVVSFLQVAPVLYLLGGAVLQ